MKIIKLIKALWYFKRVKHAIGVVAGGSSIERKALKVLESDDFIGCVVPLLEERLRSLIWQSSMTHDKEVRGRVLELLDILSLSDTIRAEMKKNEMNNVVIFADMIGGGGIANLGKERNDGQYRQ